jgi:hypothetical protein
MLTAVEDKMGATPPTQTAHLTASKALRRLYSNRDPHVLPRAVSRVATTVGAAVLTQARPIGVVPEEMAPLYGHFILH